MMMLAWDCRKLFSLLFFWVFLYMDVFRVMHVSTFDMGLESTYIQWRSSPKLLGGGRHFLSGGARPPAHDNMLVITVDKANYDHT